MLILSRFKVSGHSMLPTLKPGQEVLVSSLAYLFSKPKIGDILAFKDKKNFIVKRIKQVKEVKYFIAGDNQKDTKDYGWIGKKQILGKVIYIFPL